MGNDGMRGWVARLLSNGLSLLVLDVAFYAIFAVDAGRTALNSEFYGYRIWGNFAVVGYSLAALLALASLARVWLGRVRVKRVETGRVETGQVETGRRAAGRSWLWSRWFPVGMVVALAMAVPLVALVARRVGGRDFGSPPWAWTAQPEVWVIERSADLLVHTGSPYVDIAALGRPAVVDDYGPYGPIMALFGLPRTLLGGSALTDSRLMFALVTVAVLALAWWLAGRPRPSVRAVQLVGLTSWSTLHLVVAGNDLPVVALLMLSAVLADRTSPEWPAVLVAIAVGMKLTAFPMAAVLAVAIAANRGTRALLRYLLALVAVGTVAMLPALLVRPWSFVEHVIRFPANLAQVHSPAGSPLPGHLVVELLPGGHVIVLVLIVLAAAAIGVWLLWRPPRTAAAVLVRAGVSLAVAMALMPATRWGYLIYPVALLGAAHALARFAPDAIGSARTALGLSADRASGGGPRSLAPAKSG